MVSSKELLSLGPWLDLPTLCFWTSLLQTSTTSCASSFEPSFRASSLMSHRSLSTQPLSLPRHWNLPPTPLLWTRVALSKPARRWISTRLQKPLPQLSQWPIHRSTFWTQPWMAKPPTSDRKPSSSLALSYQIQPRRSPWVSSQARSPLRQLLLSRLRSSARSS